MSLQTLKYTKTKEAYSYRRPEKERLPTMYDLPSESVEDPGVPDQFHIWQPELLTQTFCPPEYSPKRILIATDLNLYYDVNDTSKYKRPDWYATLDVPHLYDGHDPRLSFVVWQEDAIPFIVVELLSPGTEKEDLGETSRKTKTIPTKWEVYEKILGIPYYVVFSRYTHELKAFQLIDGRYQNITPADKRLWLPEIKLGLGLWHGTYSNLRRKWLRWYDAEEKWIPTPVEKERQLAKKERQRAEKQKQLAEKQKQLAQEQKQLAEKQKQRVEKLEQQLEKEREEKKRLIETLKAAGINMDSDMAL